MNENYLHFLWKTKRLPFHAMKTCDNQEITIKHVGFHNTNESGPDFLNGKIVIDELEWCGNIELHVKSSDWYLHKHQFDLAYKNVILHVVYENDKDVIIDGSKVPTLELKQYIDWSHFDRFQRFGSGSEKINCAKSLPNVDRVYIESMLERAMVDRLNRKAFFLYHNDLLCEPQQVLYLLLARAFGGKVNQLPFEEMTNRLPISLLKKKRHKVQYDLLIATSNVFDQGDSLISNNCVAREAWKRKGLRPPSFPEIRVRQFSELVRCFDFNLLHFLKSTSNLNVIFDALFDEVSRKLTKELQLSQSFIDLIKINCLVLFLWWYGDYLSDNSLKDKALELLQTISAEKNTIVKQWKVLGVSPKSAFESQALIELYNELCAKNKCLSCEIGVKVLNL